ncbi:MAG: sugar phosphate isomerase/epimerase [Acidobacteriia bacterium]|nr:sugar phosphate isomerase/epimerase [Terriglobia bacterium]
MYPALNGTLVAGRTPWPEFAHLAAKTGYPGTDVAMKAMELGIPSTRELLSSLKLKPAILPFPVDFRKDEAAFQQGLAKLDAAAQFAAAIGCPRMGTWLLPSSEIPKDEQKKIFRARLRACADVLARTHVRLGIEFVSPVHLRKRFPYEFIYRCDEMLEFAKSCGSNAGILLDSWHWHHAGATTKDILAAGRDNIIHVQLADAPNLPPDRIMDNERLMPGEGVIDLAGFLQAVKKTGYADGISPEVFGRGLKDMAPEDGARLGLRTTQEVMRKAGVA